MTIIYNRSKFFMMDKTKDDVLIGFLPSRAAPIIFYDMFAIAKSLSIIEDWDGYNIEMYFQQNYLNDMRGWLQEQKRRKTTND